MKTYQFGKLKLELYDDFNKIKLFRVFADYRPLKTLKHKNYYYVYAWTKKQKEEVENIAAGVEENIIAEGLEEGIEMI